MPELWLCIEVEMEFGITGGVKDGAGNSGAAKDKLYSTSEEVWQVYETLAPISVKFAIAAAFSNVHGVYSTPSSARCATASLATWLRPFPSSAKFSASAPPPALAPSSQPDTWVWTTLSGLRIGWSPRPLRATIADLNQGPNIT